MYEMDNTTQNTPQLSREEKLRQLSETCVMLFDRVGGGGSGAVRTDAHIALLCLAGRATCRIGDETFAIERGDLFISSPNTFIENSKESADFRCRAMVFAPEFFEDMFILGGTSWEIHNHLESHPTLRLGEGEIRRFCDNYDFLKAKLAAPHPPHQREMVQRLLQAMMYEFCDIILPKLPPVPTYTPTEHTFRRFVCLLEQNTPRCRDVTWYADKLCLTPKHLSAICKRFSGDSAAVLIRSFTLKHLKRLLRDPAKSVKEIAAETGFDNVSFFGKYIKRELGMSPREYRLSLTE